MRAGQYNEGCRFNLRVLWRVWLGALDPAAPGPRFPREKRRCPPATPRFRAQTEQTRPYTIVGGFRVGQVFALGPSSLAGLYSVCFASTLSPARQAGMGAYGARKGLLALVVIAALCRAAHAAVGFSVDAANFQSAVVDSPNVVLLEFYSPRCVQSSVFAWVYHAWPRSRTRCNSLAERATPLRVRKLPLSASQATKKETRSFSVRPAGAVRARSSPRSSPARLTGSRGS